MTVNAVSILAEIEKLSVEDQVVLVQRIWDNVAESDTALELTKAQKDELDRRSAVLDKTPDMAISWEDVKQSIQERRRG